MGLVHNELPWEMKENKWVATDSIQMKCSGNTKQKCSAFEIYANFRGLHNMGASIASCIYLAGGSLKKELQNMSRKI